MITTIANCVLALTAILAGIVSWFEYNSYKQKENNKLLSQLNKRYMENTTIQKVIKYLRDFDSDNKKPNAYEVEVFLRYFEELGVYVEKKSLPLKYAYTFFSYYIKKYYESDKGKELQEIARHAENKLEYLILFKKKIDEYEELLKKKQK